MGMIKKLHTDVLLKTVLMGLHRPVTQVTSWLSFKLIQHVVN